MAKDKVDRGQARINEENALHTGEWLTKEACEEYQALAKKANSNDPQDIEKRRELRMELQSRYGLTEIEAVNILNGNNVIDYLNKYSRVMTMTPLIKK